MSGAVGPTYTSEVLGATLETLEAAVRNVITQERNDMDTLDRLVQANPELAPMINKQISKTSNFVDGLARGRLVCMSKLKSLFKWGTKTSQSTFTRKEIEATLEHCNARIRDLITTQLSTIDVIASVSWDPRDDEEKNMMMIRELCSVKGLEFVQSVFNAQFRSLLDP